MAMNNDAKSEEKWTFPFKIDTTIWLILTEPLKCLKHLRFNGLLLIKVYNVWAKKVQKIYVQWHWWLIQNLNENYWVVIFKMASGIWKISQAEK